VVLRENWKMDGHHHIDCAQTDMVKSNTTSVGAHNRRGASSILKFQMHHNVGFDHNRHGEEITMTVFTLTDVFVFFF